MPKDFWWDPKVIESKLDVAAYTFDEDRRLSNIVELLAVTAGSLVATVRQVTYLTEEVEKLKQQNEAK